jgi:hypothetical protein
MNPVIPNVCDMDIDRVEFSQFVYTVHKMYVSRVTYDGNPIFINTPYIKLRTPLTCPDKYAYILVESDDSGYCMLKTLCQKIDEKVKQTVDNFQTDPHTRKHAKLYDTNKRGVSYIKLSHTQREIDVSYIDGSSHTYEVPFVRKYGSDDLSRPMWRGAMVKFVLKVENLILADHVFGMKLSIVETGLLMPTFPRTIYTQPEKELVEHVSENIGMSVSSFCRKYGIDEGRLRMQQFFLQGLDPI